MTTNRNPKQVANNRRALLTGIGLSAALMSLPKVARADDGNEDRDDDDDESARVVLELLNALESLNADEIVSHLDTNVLYQNTGIFDLVGKDAVKAFLGPLTGLLTSLSIDLRNLIARRNTVVVERIENYVTSGVPIGIPGGTVALHLSSWFHVENGLVTRWSDYWDTRVFVAQTGIPLPPPTDSAAIPPHDTRW
jgi:limonene-1,2-epoxide hydrolase